MDVVMCNRCAQKPQNTNLDFLGVLAHPALTANFLAGKRCFLHAHEFGVEFVLPRLVLAVQTPICGGHFVCECGFVFQQLPI